MRSSNQKFTVTGVPRNKICVCEHAGCVLLSQQSIKCPFSIRIIANIALIALRKRWIEEWQCGTSLCFPTCKRHWPTFLFFSIPFSLAGTQRPNFFLYLPASNTLNVPSFVAMSVFFAPSAPWLLPFDSTSMCTSCLSVHRSYCACGANIWLSALMRVMLPRQVKIQHQNFKPQFKECVFTLCTHSPEIMYCTWWRDPQYAKVPCLFHTDEKVFLHFCVKVRES